MSLRSRASGAAMLGLARLTLAGWRQRSSNAPLVTAAPQPAPEAEPAAAPPAATKPARVRVRRVGGFVLDVALIAAVALTVFVAYGMIGNRWYRVVAIEGGSMEPTITRGDLIVVTPAPSKITPGMILVMGIDGRVVTHRVLEVNPDGSLVTKGDANNVADDWQGAPITVYGQYAFTIPMLGRFLPVSNAIQSGATFQEGLSSGMSIEVGDLPIADALALPSPPPDPTPAPTPEPTCDPDPSPDPSTPPDATPVPCDPGPTPSPDATPSPTPDATTDPTPEPTLAGDTAVTPAPTGTPDVPAPTPSPEPAPIPTPEPSAAPSPEPGPSPSAAPPPEAGA